MLEIRINAEADPVVHALIGFCGDVPQQSRRAADIVGFVIERNPTLRAEQPDCLLIADEKCNQLRAGFRIGSVL